MISPVADDAVKLFLGVRVCQFNPGVIRALDTTLRFVYSLFGSASAVLVFRVLIAVVTNNFSQQQFWYVCCFIT